MTLVPIIDHGCGKRFAVEASKVTADLRCSCGSDDLDLDDRTASSERSCEFCDKPAAFQAIWKDVGGGAEVRRRYACAEHEQALYWSGQVQISRVSAWEGDMPMDTLGDVASVTQHVRCSTCLQEATIKAADPAQPMPACPNCGADTLTAGAGSTLAVRKTAAEDRIEYDVSWMGRQQVPVDTMAQEMAKPIQAMSGGDTLEVVLNGIEFKVRYYSDGAVGDDGQPVRGDVTGDYSISANFRGDPNHYLKSVHVSPHGTSGYGNSGAKNYSAREVARIICEHANRRLSSRKSVATRRTAGWTQNDSFKDRWSWDEWPYTARIHGSKDHRGNVVDYAFTASLARPYTPGDDGGDYDYKILVHGRTNSIADAKAQCEQAIAAARKESSRESSLRVRSDVAARRVSVASLVRTASGPPTNVDFGSVYGGSEPAYQTPDGPVWMFRKGQKVRFYDAQGNQVGPEQSNVAPAVAYAASQGWDSGLWAAMSSRTADMQLSVDDCSGSGKNVDFDVRKCPDCGGAVDVTDGVVEPHYPKDSQVPIEERQAKVAQIADGILATNPGMNRTSALRIAQETVRRYPKVAATDSGQSCEQCGGTGKVRYAVPTNGIDEMRTCWKCGGSGKKTAKVRRTAESTVERFPKVAKAPQMRKDEEDDPGPKLNPKKKRSGEVVRDDKGDPVRNADGTFKRIAAPWKEQAERWAIFDTEDDTKVAGPFMDHGAAVVAFDARWAPQNQGLDFPRYYLGTIPNSHEIAWSNEQGQADLMRQNID